MNKVSGEAWEMMQAIKAKALCLREASDYVSAYVAWFKLDNGSKKVSVDPLKPDQMVPTYSVAQLDANLVPEMHDNCKIFPLEGSHSLLHVTPSQNVKMSVSKLSNEGIWEKVPVFIKMSQGSWYDFSAILEHSATYRLDSVRMDRIETAGPPGRRVEPRERFPTTFLLQT